MPAVHGKDRDNGFLSPDYVPDTGVTGKRPRVDGIAMPFSIKREAETASMITLNSGRMDGMASRQSGTPRPMSPVTLNEQDDLEGKEICGVGNTQFDTPRAHGDLTPGLQTPALERPGLETFVTAAEDLPKANGVATE
jgi:hypothetical protein